MHEISRQSPNYRNLAAEGVTIQKVEPMDYWKSQWRIKAWKPTNMPRDVAKAKLRAFLTAEFEGKDFEFYLDKANPDQKIVVVFTTYAL